MFCCGIDQFRDGSALIGVHAFEPRGERELRQPGLTAHDRGCKARRIHDRAIIAFKFKNM